jgi:hypothetical protein
VANSQKMLQYLLSIALVAAASALYDKGDAVIQLTEAEFNKRGARLCCFSTGSEPVDLS